MNCAGITRRERNSNIVVSSGCDHDQPNAPDIQKTERKHEQNVGQRAPPQKIQKTHIPSKHTGRQTTALSRDSMIQMCKSRGRHSITLNRHTLTKRMINDSYHRQHKQFANCVALVGLTNEFPPVSPARIPPPMISYSLKLEG